MQKAASFIVAVWFCGVGVAAPYYNWQYAKENGFLKWVILGEVVATTKALAWPYFLATASTDRRLAGTDWSNEEIDNARHFFRASEASQRATRVSNASGGGVMSEQDAAALLRDRKEALTEARLVRDDVLEKACPGLSSMFRTKFERGLELQLRNLEFSDIQAEIQGASLQNEWVDWINERSSEVRFPHKR
jgi:hypothetical protein